MVFLAFFYLFQRVRLPSSLKIYQQPSGSSGSTRKLGPTTDIRHFRLVSSMPIASRHDKFPSSPSLRVWWWFKDVPAMSWVER